MGLVGFRASVKRHYGRSASHASMVARVCKPTDQPRVRAGYHPRCTFLTMGRSTDVGEEWPEAVPELILAAFDRVEVDFDGSADAWRYGGGLDLSRLAQDARLVAEKGTL